MTPLDAVANPGAVSRVPLRPVGILRDERRANPWLDARVGRGPRRARRADHEPDRAGRVPHRCAGRGVRGGDGPGDHVAGALGAARCCSSAVVPGRRRSRRPADGRHPVGLLMFALSFAVVVFALRRWEGDRRRAREAAAAVSRNERRLIVLVDFAEQLAAVPGPPGVMRVVADDVIATADANGAILVNEGRNRVEFLVVAGHDPTAFPRETPPEYLSTNSPRSTCSGPARRVRRDARRVRRASTPQLERYAARVGAPVVGRGAGSRDRRPRDGVDRTAVVRAGATRVPRDAGQPHRRGRAAGRRGRPVRAPALRRCLRRDARRRRDPPGDP